MDNNTKIYRKSGVAIACYVFAAILLIYTCYTAGSTVGQINEYYAGYGMSAQPMEYVTYVAQSALPYMIYTVVVFMLGFILDAVRKTDPRNYMTEEEYADAKAAKKEAKEAKKIAKGEKKAAAKAEREESTVAEDFASDLDKELKADEKKGDNRKSGNGNYKRNYNPNRNGNNNHRQYSNKNGNRKFNGQGNNHNNHNNAQNKPKVESAEVQSDKAPQEDAAVFEAKVFEE